jgi:phosphate transport system permease protein
MNKDAGMNGLATTREKVEAGLRRRRRTERVFRLTGILATTVGVLFLGVFFADLIGKGSSAFFQTFIQLDVEFSEDILGPGSTVDLEYADFDGLARSALRRAFPEVTSRGERRELNRLVSVGAGYQLRDMLVADPALLGARRSVWVPASSTVDMFMKGNIDPALDEALRPLSDPQIGQRRLAGAGTRRHSWSVDGLLLHARRNRLAGVSHRCGRSNIPRGICAAQPLV